MLLLLLLIPGSVLAFRAGAFNQMVRTLEEFLSPVVVAEYTSPPTPAAFATAQPVQAASSVAETAPQQIPAAPVSNKFFAQLPAGTDANASPLPSDDLVHTSLLAAALAAFESKIDAQISTITKPPAFPQEVAAGGNGIFSYGAAAAASSYVPSAVPAAPATFSALSGSLNLASQVSGTLAIANGGTGLASAPAYGQLLMGAGDGTFTLISTSSLGISGGGSGTVSSGTQGQFAFYNASGTTITATSSLYLAQSGYIGIGTTSPLGPLHVYGAGGVYIDRTDLAANKGAALNLRKNNGLVANSTDEFGKITFSANDGTSLIQRAGIYVTGDGSVPVTAGQIPMSMSFYTGRTSLIDAMTIDSLGAVGISTSTPWARLSLDTSNLAAGEPEFTIGSSTRQDFIVTQNGNVGIGTTAPWGLLSIIAPNNSSAPQLVVGSSTATSLFVSNTGSIAIGTTTATHDDGASGGLLISGDLATDRTLEIHNSYAEGINVFTHSSSVYWRAPTINLNRSRGTQGAPTTPSTGDILGGYQFGGYDGSGYSPQALIQSTAEGNFSITNTPADLLFSTTPPGALYADSPIERMRISATGNLGIATTSPDMLLTVGGDVPSGSVAHFENSTGSCYINPTTTSLSCSSDARLKTNISALPDADGLAAVLKLNPVTYNWKTEPATTSPHTGFIAQEVEPVLPDLVSRGPDGYYTLNYAGLTPYLVKAIQEIAAISGTFKANLIAWLGSAENGITDLFAATFHGHLALFDEARVGELCATKSDGSNLCVTGDQLAALLSQSAAANPSTSVTSSGTSQATNFANPGNANSTPPVISINGANPATIPAGTTYADLGATITAPLADLNLGLTVVVDNATSTDGTVQIDTSSPGTHTIIYTVTDPAGLTGSATRTVIVSTPQPTPPPAHHNTPPAANDNVASTTATSTAQ